MQYLMPDKGTRLSLLAQNAVVPTAKEDLIVSQLFRLHNAEAATSLNVGVSVIIVNYNGGACLAASVGSVLGQCEQLIVVDNASTDDSLDGLDSLASGDQLKIIRNKENLGFAKACNIGARAATGNFFLFLNPDCIVESAAVSSLVSSLSGDSDYGMAGGLLLNPDGTEQQGARRAVPTPWRSFVRAFGLSRLSKRWPRLFFDFHLHKQPLPHTHIEVEAISGACMLVRRVALDEVGLLDEGYFMHCEDLDWCMRFRRNGWKILFVPEARLLHYQGTCSKSRPVFVEWHKHKGMVRFYRKFFRHQYPGGLMMLVTVGVWMRFTGVVIYRGVARLAKLRR